MIDLERAGIIASETAAERSYNAGLNASAREKQRQLNQLADNSWTTQLDAKAPRVGELIGRIDLGAPHPDLDDQRDFYLGSSKWDGPGMTVFSWAAPIAACTYYGLPADRPDLDDVARSVAGVRVFRHEGDRIADFEDEVRGRVPESGLFPTKRLEVPRAPSKRPPSPVSATGPAQAPASIIPSKPTGSTAATERFGDLLRRELAAPKRARMSTVLATLQPDQYEAITRPPGESQVLQGHPGTGKTIIAAHRAAYLLSEEVASEQRPKGDVLVLGPTKEYSAHVGDAVRKLLDDPRRVRIVSIPTLLEELAGLPKSGRSTQTTTWQDADESLVHLVDLAFTRAKQNGGASQWPTRDDVYAEFKWLIEEPPQDGLESEWMEYLRTLPDTFAALLKKQIPAYRGLLAYIAVRSDRQRAKPGHIIIDEAQDIHPIEWHVLGRLGNSGGWTIVGDLNQRRTDHTFTSWSPVARLLGIEDATGNAPVQILDRSYRSTMQIMKFANQLLPRQYRGVESLQRDGEAPTLVRVPAEREIVRRAVDASVAQRERIVEGTVAIITMRAREVEAALRTREWRRRSGDDFVWERNEQKIWILPPERARGLEFDGVTVIEPAEFPPNYGRQGVLYTALTRANRYLNVIHHRAMPDGLRTR